MKDSCGHRSAGRACLHRAGHNGDHYDGGQSWPRAAPNDSVDKRGAIVVRGPLTVIALRHVRLEAVARFGIGKHVGGDSWEYPDYTLVADSGDLEGIYREIEPHRPLQGMKIAEVMGCAVEEHGEGPGIWRLEWPWTP